MEQTILWKKYLFSRNLYNIFVFNGWESIFLLKVITQTQESGEMKDLRTMYRQNFKVNFLENCNFDEFVLKEFLSKNIISA